MRAIRKWAGDALFLPRTRSEFRALINLGFTDAVRAATDEPGLYTFWDYQAGAWQKNNGIRIDHMLLSPAAADRLTDVGIDRHVRTWEKPSDHVPVWLDLAIDAASQSEPTKSALVVWPELLNTLGNARPDLTLYSPWRRIVPRPTEPPAPNAMAPSKTPEHVNPVPEPQSVASSPPRRSRRPKAQAASSKRSIFSSRTWAP